MVVVIVYIVKDLCQIDIYIKIGSKILNFQLQYLIEIRIMNIFPIESRYLEAPPPVKDFGIFFILNNFDQSRGTSFSVSNRYITELIA